MQTFVAGETIPFEYTFLGEDENPIDLAESAISKLGVVLLQKRKEKVVKYAEWAENPTGEEKHIEVAEPSSLGKVVGVIDPEFSASLPLGRYILRFFIRLNTGVNVLYPDSFDKRFLSDELEFELT